MRFMDYRMFVMYPQELLDPMDPRPGKAQKIHSLHCPLCGVTARLPQPPVLFTRASGGVNVAFASEAQARG